MTSGMAQAFNSPYVQFYPTVRCNLECSFCFNRGLSAFEDVRVDDFRRIVSILHEEGIRWVDFLGGEPTLHPYLVTLLKILRDGEMGCNLSTNGTGIEILRFLSKKFEKEFLRIGVSLHETRLSAELHDYIITHRPVLKSVMGRKIALAKACEAYAHQPGIEYFVLFRDAIGKDDLGECMPFHSYLRKLTHLKRAHPGLDGVFCTGFIENATRSRSSPSPRCPAGTTKLSMLPDGSVYPCYLFFRYPEFELGNVLEDGFRKVWESPILDFFRAPSPNPCPDTGCRLFPSCHGGCPAHAYAFSHDLAAPDPRCMG